MHPAELLSPFNGLDHGIYIPIRKDLTYIGGVPGCVFDYPGDYDIRFSFQGFKSRKELIAEVGPELVRISTGSLPPRDGDRFFIATLTDGKLKYDIRTRGNLREKAHPDLYAEKLFRSAYNYFSIRRAYSIDSIRGEWTEGTNYSVFVERKKHYLKRGKNPEEAQLLAAKDTWTGKIAASLGYRNVAVRVLLNDSIHAAFFWG